MNEPPDVEVLQEFQDRFHVDLRRPEKFQSEGSFETARPLAWIELSLVKKDPPGKGKTVAVKSRGGNADDPVPDAYFGTVDQFVRVNHSAAEAGQVIVAVRVKSRHLGRFPPDQGAARLLTSLNDSLHDLNGRLHADLAGGDVIQKEQGLRPLHNHIVDRHGHKIDPDRIVLVHHLGNLEFGPHTVG